MNQLGINFDLPPQPAHDAESLTLIDVVHCRPGLFRADFADWLQENWPIWKAFERRATEIRNAGRTHFGHRMIWESIRYETALREENSEWKLNNIYCKSCARLFVLLNPDCDGFFEFREKGA